MSSPTESWSREPVVGEISEISGGGYTAEVVAVGGSLRSLRFQGRDLIVPFAGDALRPALRGAILAPWPNRLADGRYSFGGTEHQLPLSEPETGNAAHGLVAWQRFVPTQHSRGRVVMTTVIEPRSGYPWRVRIEAEFEVSSDGLSQRLTATNLSAEPTPVVLGAHPYVLAGPAVPGGVDAWMLELPAESVLLVSEDRLLPERSVQVNHPDGAEFDFRVPRRIGSTVLNHAFSALTPSAAGEVVIGLTGPSGRVELRLDQSVPWVQLYSADGLPADERRHALAVEPMTGPPDAFNSGTDLRVLGPGEQTSLRWMLRALV